MFLPSKANDARCAKSSCTLLIYLANNSLPLFDLPFSLPPSFVQLIDIYDEE